jgi:aryl-alcohol dehydrogenase-like predicted oxidoreductase
VRRHDIDVVMLANRWTLTDRSGAGVLAQCRARNVPVIAAAPFNGGTEVADPTPYLRFPKKNPAVALVLVGMRSATEVRQNLAAVIGSSR